MIKYTWEIEETEGRGTITLRIIVPLFARDQVFSMHKKIAAGNEIGEAEMMSKGKFFKFGLKLFCF